MTASNNNAPETFVRHAQELNYAMLIVGQCGIPACAEGDPGIGKTATMRALAQATNRRFLPYELSRTEPEDLQGFPVVKELIYEGLTHEYMKFVPDERLLRAQIEPSLLLMDEVTNVGPAKQAPALNLVSHGMDLAWMFMCCNPLHNAADGHPLTCPFINRIWYGSWEIDEEAQNWGLTHQCQYPLPDVPIVPPDYLQYQPKWGYLLVDFFRYNPQLRNACPDKENERHKPWPSSRSWDHVTRALAGADAVGASDKVRDTIIKGLVGEKAATAFLAYIAQLKLPKPEDILADPSNFTWPKRYDTSLAIITSVVGYLKRNQTEELMEAAIQLVWALKKHNAEMATVLRAGIRQVNPKLIEQDDKRQLQANTK